MEWDFSLGSENHCLGIRKFSRFKSDQDEHLLLDATCFLLG